MLIANLSLWDRLSGMRTNVFPRLTWVLVVWSTKCMSQWSYSSLRISMRSHLWQRLPAYLCILAHEDESIARGAVPRIMILFNKDPRPPPITDEYTWKLLQPGAQFRLEMLSFGNGTPRWVIVCCVEETTIFPLILHL